MNIFKSIGRAIVNAFYFLIYIISMFFLKIFMRCKIVGKENLRKDDQVRVIISNHLQVYGPTVMHVRFPMRKKAIWINEKMMDKQKIEHEMGLAIYDENNYKWAPRWLKTLVIKLLKNLVYYILKYHAHGISISRDNRRELINTFQTSLEYTEKGRGLMVFPEVDYQEKGIGEIFAGFTSFGKFVHKKTGKIVSFYPVYINRQKKKMYIGKPINYNPENPNYSEEIVDYLKGEINHFSEISELKKEKKSKKSKKEKVEEQI